MPAGTYSTAKIQYDLTETLPDGTVLLGWSKTVWVDVRTGQYVRAVYSSVSSPPSAVASLQITQQLQETY